MTEYLNPSKQTLYLVWNGLDYTHFGRAEDALQALVDRKLPTVIVQAPDGDRHVLYSDQLAARIRKQWETRNGGLPFTVALYEPERPGNRPCRDSRPGLESGIHALPPNKVIQGQSLPEGSTMTDRRDYATYDQAIVAMRNTCVAYQDMYRVRMVLDTPSGYLVLQARDPGDPTPCGRILARPPGCTASID